MRIRCKRTKSMFMFTNSAVLALNFRIRLQIRVKESVLYGIWLRWALAPKKITFQSYTFSFLFKATGFRTKAVKVNVVYKESVKYLSDLIFFFFKRIVKLKKTEEGKMWFILILQFKVPFLR